ncbi:MAG: hypothetical protein H0W81_00165 [Chloroflexi bacterium]|nr:hypothetical protein [Chloroflexota bacterium]
MASGFVRSIAFLLFVGLLAVVGFNIYNAGVTAGINSDIGAAIASGAPIPAGYYSGAYLGHPGGFGFGGFLIGIFFLFIFFGLLRAAFGSGRWGHHGGSGSSRFGRHGGWNEYMGSWHEEQHGKAPDAPAPDKA